MSECNHNKNDYALLRDTIRKKDKVTARRLILNKVDVNNPRSRFNTPLHWAIIQFEDLEIMTMLLDRGANIHATNQHNLKPLDIAIQNNKSEAAMLLIKKGALDKRDLNALLLKLTELNRHKIFKSIIDDKTQANRNVNFKILFNTAISLGHAKILEPILPHCQFSEPSDLYIPREIVIKYGQQFEDCVDLLIKWNFTIDPDSKQDHNFIYRAVESGHLQIVLQLLQLQVNANSASAITELNLLKVACLNKHHEIVENLLKHNAVVNETTPSNICLLDDPLVYFGNISLLWSYNPRSLNGLTCLQIAVFNFDPKMTRILLKYGARIVDDPTFFIITSRAVQVNCEEIVRVFLDQGVNVNDTDTLGNSLLHFCMNGIEIDPSSRYNTARLLLERGATFHLQIPGNSLLFEAINHRYHKIARLFLDYQADIQYISSDGDTLLHKAIEKNFDLHFLNSLLERNLPVNAVNNNMLTPLHYIGKYRNDMTENIIRLFLKYNANIEAKDAKGWTPLFMACKSENVKAVRCFLDNSADANCTDLEDLTPLYIAAKYSKYNSEVVQILLNHKVNVHCMDKQGNSIIHIIVENNCVEVIESLADTQVNFNAVNNQGNTPLHIAINKESHDMIESLIKYGANINILDKNNQTPLQKAIKCISHFRRRLEDYRNRQDSFSEYAFYSDNSIEDEYDIESFSFDTYGYKKIVKNLKIHVIKLKVAGLKVKEQNLNTVYNRENTNDNEFFDQYDTDIALDELQFESTCEEEIERMKMENIGIKNITLCDMLRKDIHFLSRYVKNKEIEKTLNLKIYDEKFSLYMDIVRSRFRDAKLRYRFVNLAKKYFSLRVCSRLPDECVDTVFSYLNIKEMKMFIRAFKPLVK